MKRVCFGRFPLVLKSQSVSGSQVTFSGKENQLEYEKRIEKRLDQV